MKFNHLVRGLTLAAPNPFLRRELWMPVGAAALLLGSSAALLAQASSGITGTVTDPSGAVIPGAAIVITNTATGITNNVLSSSSGTYSVTGLVPGLYKVEVTAQGFTKSIRNGVNVEVTVTTTADVQLTNGSSSETVEVTANLITLNTTAPELGTTIEPAVVNNLPVAIGGGKGRQISSLQFLAPGVSGDTFSHNVNGGVNFEQEILYNGVPVPQAETAGYTENFNPPFELVSEFRVERSTFSAKYGLAQGAVTYQTTSGTNQYHGDAFYVNRNEFFDAKGYFNSRAPVDRENNYGFTIGGPASIPHLYNARDRTFFTFALDFAKTNNTNATIGTVPTAAMKTGDFSGYVDGNGNQIPIYDPLTGQQFQYQGRPNVIDPARISALSASIIPFIPDPNLVGANGQSLLQHNRTATPNAFPFVNHNWGLSFDHKLTDKQSLHYAMWRNSFSSTGFDGSTVFPIDNPLQSTKFQPNLGTVFLLNYVNALTPNLVVTAGADWVGEINNQFSNSPVVNFPGIVQAPQSAGFFPKIRFDGTYNVDEFGVGDDAGNDAQGESNSINRKLGIAFVNNWLWTKGRHTFNFGGEVRRAYQDDDECQNCVGNFEFRQASTANPAALGSTGSSFASFLIGAVDHASRTFANELRLRNLLVASYVQDDIKFTPKLTVNLGLRWDIMLPFKEKDNQIVFLDPTAANSVAGGLLGSATRFNGANGGVDRADIHLRNFGPRIGVAYQLNEKTVLQAGYNIAYLNGGAYEFGTSKVATSYGNLLQGVFTRNSTGGVAPGYGYWDGNPLPAPASQAVGPALGIANTIRAFDPKAAGRAPYLQSWNFNFQRQLPWNTFLQIAYIGNRALHLDGQLNPMSQPNPSILQNGPLLQASFSDPAGAAALAAAGFSSPYSNYAADFGGSASLAHALSPYPQYANVYNNFDMTGTAAYNGVQASLEKRFSNGLSFLTSYSLSRELGNVDSAFTTFAALPENKYDQRKEYTVTGNDELNNIKVSGTYELPLGSGKSFLNNKGITGQLVGGIQVGFILDYETGTPFGISENGNPLGCAGCFNRPDEVAGQKRSTGSYHKFTFVNGNSTRAVFNTAAFAPTPQDASQQSYYTLGNAYRNYAELRQPGIYNESIKASKKFPLGEHVNFLLEMNYFNILNRTRFNGPDTNANDANYGLVPGNGQQGLSGSQSGARQGQLSARINF